MLRKIQQCVAARFADLTLVATRSRCSRKETHICVMDRDGKAALEAKAATLPAAIAAELAKAPVTQRIVFETGRMERARTDPSKILISQR
jgi:hypothetical protein